MTSESFDLCLTPKLYVHVATDDLMWFQETLVPGIVIVVVLYLLMLVSVDIWKSKN